jgi:hypothetical protein
MKVMCIPFFIIFNLLLYHLKTLFLRITPIVNIKFVYGAKCHSFYMFLNIFNFIYELQHRLPLGTLSFETKSATVSFSARSKQIKHASDLLIKIKKKSFKFNYKKKKLQMK